MSKTMTFNQMVRYINDTYNVLINESENVYITHKFNIELIDIERMHNDDQIYSVLVLDSNDNHVESVCVIA